MPYTFSELVALFFTYSVIGWLWETIYCSIKDHQYEYRGFLFGPYCPVYGFAVTTILVATHPFQNNIFLLFIVGAVVATLFELIASIFLQKFFHLKLWDYSNLKWNFQGRIAPEISLFWGIGVVALVKFVQPFVQKIIDWEESYTHGYEAIIILTVMGVDFIATIISVKKFHTSTQLWNTKINDFLDKHKAELDHSKLHAELKKHLPSLHPHTQLSWNARRLIRNFPKLKVIDANKFNEMKGDILAYLKNMM
ncbi:putative ABC transporter permease [Lactobacillus sp. PV012]|uniref:putative ABC transporter permease n=1 Tax=Lactobacillus sp. PV012 TaxID=2594494 RepID=UPI00223F8765|nr:putative ABC transporter permease [Lactobacillus sp. PV012]QNQ81997.1 putative ABC transporter permease [Lactobacillus sp. PV012]